MNKILLSLLTLSLAACVTINIYFPAAAVEKAADKIIDEVWQLQKEKNKDKEGSKKLETQVQTPVQEGSPK